MKIFILFLTSFVLSFTVTAQTDHPAIQPSGKSSDDFVPDGWKIIARADGDVNKDGLEDVALVIENTNPANFIRNDGMGGDTLNINPRILIVLLKNSQGNFTLAAKNNRFIPPQNNQESPCLLDPFGENGGIIIEKGLLKIHFQNFYSCGAWEIYSYDYTFRFQNHKFELIGYDASSIHRSSGETSYTSINFSTKKMSETSGGNEFFEEKNKPQTTWKKINIAKLPDVAGITEEKMDAILNR